MDEYDIDKLKIDVFPKYLITKNSQLSIVWMVVSNDLSFLLGFNTYNDMNKTHNEYVVVSSNLYVLKYCL
jgi:hypothetical protein